MGTVKLFLLIGLLQLSTFKTAYCREESDRADWISQNATQKSIQQLKAQANLLLKNSKALANGPLKNAQQSLTLAAASLKLVAKNFNVNAAMKMLNTTIRQMLTVTNNVNLLASSQGVDTKTCYRNATTSLYNLTQEYMGEMSACAIDKVTEGMVMINDNLEYITTILNETTAFPVNLNACMNSTSFKAEYTCLMNLIKRMTFLILNVPASITTRINSVYSYVNLFPTSLTLCATNTTFAATADGAGVAFEMTSCVLEKILGLNK